MTCPHPEKHRHPSFRAALKARDVLEADNDDALIAKAAHVLLPYLSYTDDDFPDEAARAVVAVVRDQIAAGALREAADAIESGEVDHEELRRSGVDDLSPLGWTEASVIAAHDAGSVWSDWLRARAEALCGDESAGEAGDE